MGPLRRLGVIIVNAILLTGSVVAIGAQSTPQPDEGRVNKGNWALANRFTAASLRSITYTQTVLPHFLGKTDSLWYNWKDHNGARFYLYVPSPTGGNKQLLFEPNKLAEQLTTLSKKPYDATNLPFTTITFLKSHKGFRFTADTVRYEWTLATETLKSLGRVVRGAPPAADEEIELNGRGAGGAGGGGFGGGGNVREFRAWNPDSTAFVFALNHNLYFVEKGKADTLRISTDGVEEYSFGARDTSENRRQLNALGQGGGQQDDQTEDTQADAGNEMRVRPQVTWSPDGRSFSFVRRDQRKVRDLYLVNVLAQPRPVLLHYKYTMPGEENVTHTELWVYRRGEKAITKINVAKWKDQTLMDTHWPVNGDKVRLVRRDRPQRATDFIEVDVTTGAVNVLLTDAVEGASIEPKNVAYLRKGGDFLWWSQKTGWGMYYVHGFDGGEKHALTTGQWNVNSIAKIDSTTGTVWVSGQGREPGEQLYQTHLYRVNSTGSGLTLLDRGNAHHALTLGENGAPSIVSPSGKYVYDNASRMDLAPTSVVRDGVTGKQLAKLEEMDLSKLKELGFKFAETFSVKAADGVTELYGNLWKPVNFDSTNRYPVVVYVYPGPQTEGMTTGFSVRQPLLQLAQLGFVVVEVGHRGGSPLRSLAYHRFGYYNMRDYALADKKSSIEQLAARHAYIDLSKVGIFGHSGGGFMTAAAMLLPPFNEFFKVGWSESGNHDNNIYNQNWSEWNHGVKVMAKGDSGTNTRARVSSAAAGGRRGGGGGPGAGATVAATASGMREVAEDSLNQDSIRFVIKVPTNEELAGNLKGNLALTTGDLDNNVHPGNTIRLANALIKANKRFDFYVYPGQPHGYRDTAPYNQRMLLEYFAEHLLGDYYKGSGEIK